MRNGKWDFYDESETSRPAVPSKLPKRQGARPGRRTPLLWKEPGERLKDWGKAVRL